MAGAGSVLVEMGQALRTMPRWLRFAGRLEREAALLDHAVLLDHTAREDSGP